MRRLQYDKHPDQYPVNSFISLTSNIDNNAKASYQAQRGLNTSHGQM
jgi:hypothetical protein